MAQLLADERQSHELVVLVAVADDQVIGLLGQRDHGLQFRLGSAFESDAVWLPELVDLLHHVALLVDLDREHGRVLARVAVLLDCGLELLAELMHARAEQVGEPQQHRHGDALCLEILRELEQVDLTLRMIAIRAHDDVAPGIDVEISATPAFHVVESASVIDGPRHGSA